MRSIFHRQLLQLAPNAQTAGTMRTQQNWIGGNDYNPCGADFVPPPVEELPELLDDLCTAINDDRLPPVVQAALVHAQFETIHPVDDGNGRTGRALIHVVLRRRAVATQFVPPTSVVLAAAKDRYIDGLTGFRGEGVEPWIEYFSGVVARAAHLAVGYLDAVRTLTVEWRSQLAALPDAPRAGATAWSAIDMLPAHPMITVPVAAAATGRTESSVHQAMEQLEAAGVLRPLSTSKRYQSWEAVGLLELIASMDVAMTCGFSFRLAKQN